MPRFVERLATAVVAVVVMAGAAHADSRLFSARADQANVTITGATLAGKPLTIAGQGGGVTFFRIDNPGGAVPCAEHIDFTASSGVVASIDTDVCANGAQVVVPFSTAATQNPPAPAPQPAQSPPPAQPSPPPAPPASAPAPAEQPAAPPPAGLPRDTRVVTISVDDPNVTINGVFMGGKPVAINRRDGNAVVVLLGPGLEASCSRDLGLTLSDGRRIARAADICANNGRVNIALGSSSGAAATTTPPPPPAGPPSTQPPPPPPGGAQAPAGQDSVWTFTQTGGNGSLAFAIPNTDQSEFTAVCAPGSNEATLALGRSAPDVKPGGAVIVAFSAGPFSQTYEATGSDASQANGLSNPLIKLKTDDPLWPALIRESALTIRIGSAAPYSLPLKGSSVAARQFLVFCSPAPPQPTAGAGVPPPGPNGPSMAAPPPPGGGIPFACNDGSFISVVFDDANRRVIVSDGPAPPVTLTRTASQRGARYAGSGGVLVGYAETITWSRAGRYPATCRPR